MTTYKNEDQLLDKNECQYFIYIQHQIISQGSLKIFSIIFDL